MSWERRAGLQRMPHPLRLNRTDSGGAMTEDIVCEHGVSMDVHCCGCHSGFLFDVMACTCLTRAAVATHGVDCRKVKHLGTGDGYVHGANDDAPYDVDGVWYCGRCHAWLGDEPEPSPKRPTVLPFFVRA